MNPIAAAAEHVLRAHPHPALRISELVELLAGPLDRALDEAKLRTVLERYPDHFRLLDPWRGPWRALAREGDGPARHRDVWVVAVEDPERPSADGGATAALERSVEGAVDYLLFVDEAKLGRIKGTSGFAERFSALGPSDGRGRSLRQLQLDGRLMRYPLSYLIYSPAFDGLPQGARDAIYRRLWDVLSGNVDDARYAHLLPPDREAIVEILVATKPGLPEYFGAAVPSR
ncbi:MAG: hypothetical protein EHM50_06460 [Lysobacterales bacterium]|nr:MAG: hypothetical protein EHM50_06460 [Xanthomonadales bacterium]